MFPNVGQRFERPNLQTRCVETYHKSNGTDLPTDPKFQNHQTGNQQLFFRPYIFINSSFLHLFFFSFFFLSRGSARGEQIHEPDRRTDREFVENHEFLHSRGRMEKLYDVPDLK